MRSQLHKSAVSSKIIQVGSKVSYSLTNIVTHMLIYACVMVTCNKMSSNTITFRIILYNIVSHFISRYLIQFILMTESHFKTVRNVTCMINIFYAKRFCIVIIYIKPCKLSILTSDLSIAHKTELYSLSSAPIAQVITWLLVLNNSSFFFMLRRCICVFFHVLLNFVVHVSKTQFGFYLPSCIARSKPLCSVFQRRFLPGFQICMPPIQKYKEKQHGSKVHHCFSLL